MEKERKRKKLAEENRKKQQAINTFSRWRDTEVTSIMTQGVNANFKEKAKKIKNEKPKSLGTIARDVDLLAMRGPQPEMGPIFTRTEPIKELMPPWRALPPNQEIARCYNSGPDYQRKPGIWACRERSSRRILRKASPIPASRVLHIGQLTRNVNENHLREIFGNFGEIVQVRLAMDHTVNLPKGSGYVEFKTRADAEKAQAYMDGAQIDGKIVQAKFTLPERKKVSPPAKAVGTGSRRDAPRADNVGADAENDGLRRQRESSPRRKPPLSPPQRRSPEGSWLWS